VVTLALLACAGTFLGLFATPAAGAAPRRPADNTYDLPEPRVFLEGIGVDRRAGWIYVSATNRMGTIYRGRVGSGQLETWQPPRAGNDGRGIDVDRDGRVYVAGGPSGEVRVFSRSGALLAELPTRRQGSFLNDVWVGPDGAAYVTDSSLPIIWRVRQQHGRFRIERWLNVSRTITYTPATPENDKPGPRRHEDSEPSILLDPFVAGPQPPPVDDGSLLIAVARGVLYGLYPSNGQIKWATRRHRHDPAARAPAAECGASERAPARPVR